MRRLLLMAASLGLLLGLAACDVSLAGDVTPPPGSSGPVIEPDEELVEISMPGSIDLTAGAEIYVEKCADCHGPQGLGDGLLAEELEVLVPPIGVLEQAFTASPQEWFVVVRDGRMAQMMPPFSGSLSDQDIWDVLGYVYALGSDPALLAEGEDLYGEFCAACHGTNGEGGVEAPGHQDPARMTGFSLAEIVQKISTGSGNETHVFADVLDADQQTALALYVRSLLFGRADFELAAEPTEDVEPQDEADSSEEAAEGEGDAAPEGDTGEQGEQDAEPTAEGIEVRGQVFNGSGTGIPEGLEVSLQGYTEFELTLDVTAPVAEDGSFIFENVPLQANDVYITVVEFEDMFYPSDFYVAAGDEQELTFELEIFDTTTDKSSLAVYRTHVFFEWLSPDVVQVVHLVTVSNLGNATVYTPGEEEPVLEFSLPDGAVNLVFETGAIGNPYVGTAEGFGDPRPVAPGETAYEILFAYEMEYDRGLTWTLPIDLPTEFLAVFVSGNEVKVESDQLTQGSDQQVEGGLYQSLTATSLAAGDEVSLQISGRVRLESSESGAIGDTDLLVIVAGVFGVGLAAYGVWQFFRTPKEEDEYLADVESQDSDALLDEIVALDEAFEAGEIDAEVYRSRRAELKEKLRILME